MRLARQSLALLSMLLLPGCVPATNVAVTPAPTRRPPPPQHIVPLEVAVVRSEAGRLLVQTNRPAYVALFEIVPERGVAVVYPASVRQRNVVLSGLTWVATYWTIPASSYDRRVTSTAYQPRYVYAVASDMPLRLTDDSYDATYMRRVLGSAYWASNPYAAVRALSRQFVRPQPDEYWGEDLYAVPATTGRAPYAVARVYCPDGSVFEVREELAGRAWCPPRVRVGGGPPRVEDQPGRGGAAAPDSVLASNGKPVSRRPFDPGAGRPVYRVPEPTRMDPPRVTDAPGQGSGGDRGADKSDKARDEREKAEKEHDDNGRRAHGDPQNADPRGRGNGVGNGGSREQPAGGGDGGGGGVGQQELRQQGQPGKSDSAQQKLDRGDKPDTGVKQETKPETKPDRVESKPDKADSKPETSTSKPDPKPDVKPDSKPDQKEQPATESKAKPDEKEQAKGALESFMRRRGPKQDQKDSTSGKPKQPNDK